MCCNSSLRNEASCSESMTLISCACDACMDSRIVEMRSGDSRAGMIFAPSSSTVLCASVAGSWRMSIGICGRLTMNFTRGASQNRGVTIEKVSVVTRGYCESRRQLMSSRSNKGYETGQYNPKVSIKLVNLYLSWSSDVFRIWKVPLRPESSKDRRCLQMQYRRRAHRGSLVESKARKDTTGSEV